MNQLLLWGLLLAVKHFIADGPLQTPYQYLNKGRFGHPGGWLHAGIHGFFTACIFKLSLVGITIGFIEASAHYIIDYTKVNATQRFKWSHMRLLPDRQRPVLVITSDYYFWALVADQSAHFACYAAILALVAR